MSDVVVLGAGAGGLQVATLLAGDGHRVTVLERDAAPPPGGPEEAWGDWRRRGVAQFSLPHVLLPRWRELAEAELPAVVDGMGELGALRFNMLEAHPDMRGELRPDDARFVSVTARRPVFELAMARVAEALPEVSVRRGVAVQGLVTQPGAGGVPQVTGVRTDAGTVDADLVVDCGGRRSALASWVAEAGGGPVAEEREDSGYAYYARHYRSLDGTMPEGFTTRLTHHDSVSILTLPADNDTWSVVLVAGSADRDLLPLKDTTTWERALKLYPEAAHWAQGEPLEGIRLMTGIEDRIRYLVVDGVPAITGVVAVGDAWACTNPSVGRGISIALEHALCLRDVLRKVGAERAEDLALTFAAATAEAVEPRFRSTLAFDRHRLAEIRADIEGVPYEPDDPTWAIIKALVAASAADAEVLRAFVSVASLLATPDEIMGIPGLLDRVIALGAEAPRYPLAGPDRAELLAAVAG
jgi:2-polyprenyl-6-methoxyphenol hydroxylase-like FAD-dependent oxidoreductase